MSSKFQIDNNPSSFENAHLNQTDLKTDNIAKFEIAKVTLYNESTKVGLVEFNGGQTQFRNISSVIITPGDMVVLGYANNSEHLICFGVNSYVNKSSLIRFEPTLTATGGLAFDTTAPFGPTYNSFYSKVNSVVSFSIVIDFSHCTNFGTGQYKVELPFLPIDNFYNHFVGWLWEDSTIDPDLASHSIINADHRNSGSKILDLHWLYATTATPKPIQEQVFQQGNPAIVTTNSKGYINGTYVTGESLND